MAAEVKIKKSFPGFEVDVELTVNNGVTALLGESGSGKSVTLKCIAGIERPDEGRIEVDGRTVFDAGRHIDIPAQKRRVGLLLQGGALFPNMDVERNILSGRRDMEKDAAKARANELMERFHLTGQRRQYPNELSGGQAQRCALARILMGEPDILLLDEPLTALDSTLKWQLEQELAEAFSAFKGTVIYVTHDRGEAYRLCDRVSVVSNGRAHGTVDKHRLFGDPETRAAAMLTGCRNISRAKATPDGILALDWGATLPCSVEAAQSAAYVGVRAHSLRLAPAPAGAFVPASVSASTSAFTSASDSVPASVSVSVSSDSGFVCRVQRVIEDVFENMLVLATPAGALIYCAAPTSAPFAPGDVVAVSADPGDVLPLREE